MVNSSLPPSQSSQSSLLHLTSCLSSFSLEQLFERESELQQQKGNLTHLSSLLLSDVIPSPLCLLHSEIVENLEGYLVEMKQQTTALYVDYANKANEWDDKEKVTVEQLFISLCLCL
jgi:hypothetical protein